MIWEIDEKKRTIEGLDAEGRPDPAYAAALGLLNAPFGRRALAVACDYAVFLLLQLPLWIGAMPLLAKLMTGSVSTYGFVNHPSFVLAAVMAGVTVLLTLAFSIVQLVLHGRKGVTIGKAIAGIRSVNVRTLERPGAGPVLLRFLIIVGSGLVPAIGPALFLLSPTFDPSGRGRGWHDKATGVWLVDVRQGLHPYDEKRMRVARKVVKAEPTMERSALPSLATPLDPGAQPEYRPGSRVSAGVLGVARPHESRERPSIGLSQSAPRTEAAPAEAGKPADFFGATPAAAKFVSTKVTVNGQDAKIEGNLTLNGVTKPVTIEVEFNQAGAAMGAYKAGFDGEATIKRSDFGINYALPAVSDEVKLHIEGEFVIKS